jgi:uncharacterized protein
MTPELEQAKYISLTTFRKDGREVATPVWCVPLDGKLYIYTNGNMGKVKRIRATKRVRVAACNASGKVLGAASDGMGRIVTEPDLQARFYAAMVSKYGLVYRLLALISSVSGRSKDRVIAELAV